MVRHDPVTVVLLSLGAVERAGNPELEQRGRCVSGRWFAAPTSRTGRLMLWVFTPMEPEVRVGARVLAEARRSSVGCETMVVRPAGAPGPPPGGDEVRMELAAFDARVTVWSKRGADETRVWLASPEVLEDVCALFDAGASELVLYDSDRQVCATFGAIPEEDVSPALLTRCLNILGRLATLLPLEPPPTQPKRTYDSLVLRGVLVLPVALLIAAVWLDATYGVVQGEPWGVGLLTGLLGAAVVAGALRVLQRRGSLRSSTAVAATVASLVCLPIHGVLYASTMNRWFDGSRPVTYATRVERRYTERTRSGYGHGTRYRLALRSWLPTPAAVELAVPQRVWETVSVGQELQVRVHPGWLGYPWVESLTVRPHP